MIDYPVVTSNELKKTPSKPAVEGRGRGEVSSPRGKKGSTHKRNLFNTKELFPCTSPKGHAESPKLI
jgi:hypothetical protein